ncbi:CHAD domain-containing protein [Arthrobacter celericrescens]|uniref:CHAD domain-containing protein n=1 Tax=Arthrobacter celericrescens TaxID=2320851 RepID=UPI0013C45476|nr:CHAD domain-containing protein [Arthrobacter celericrescens]
MGKKARKALEAYTAAQLNELDNALPLLASTDHEAVHRCRLAIRRLRSVLACYRGLVTKLPKPVRKDIRWLATSLGEARDAHVLAQRMRLSIDAQESWESPDALYSSVGMLDSAAGRAAARLGRKKRARRVVNAVRASLAAGQAPRIRKPALASRLQEQWDRMREQLEGGAAGTDQAARNTGLHEARKDIKRLRYAAEAVTEVFGPDASAIIQPAITLQRLLGEQHDAVVAGEWLVSLEGGPGIDARDLHLLVDVELRRQARAEGEFRRAAVEYPIPAPRRALNFHAAAPEAEPVT